MLKYHIQVLDKYNGWKITIVDWGSNVKIQDEIGLSDPRVEFQYIDKKVTGIFKTPFSEVHSLNYAARLSQAEFIGRLDQDTMIGKRFLTWFFEKDLCNPKCFYFSKRTDLKPGVLSFQGDSTPNAPLSFEPWKCAVGIFLVPKFFWHQSTGYDERNIYFNHMEHEFIFRLKKKIDLVDLSAALNYDFYHLNHNREVENRIYNERLGEKQLTALKYVANDPRTWGLASFV